jgi:hypothetical protein
MRFVIAFGFFAKGKGRAKEARERIPPFPHQLIKPSSFTKKAFELLFDSPKHASFLLLREQRERAHTENTRKALGLSLGALPLHP